MEFIRGEVSAPPQDALVVVKLLFEVDYSPLLRCGAVFAIMEAGKCVGMGRVGSSAVSGCRVARGYSQQRCSNPHTLGSLKSKIERWHLAAK